MRKTKSEGKTVGILIGLRNSQSVRNLFARLRISQRIYEIGNGCEFGNVVCEFGNAANLAMWFANLAKWFAKLAMRNFAKLLKFYVRQMNSVLWLANFAMPTEIAN